VTQQDQVFMTRFSGMLGFLVFLTVAIIFLAKYIHAEEIDLTKAGAAAATQSRIAPVGSVHVGEVPAKTEAPVAAVAEEVAVAAEPAEIDPAALYQTSCFACHGTGAAGAPKLEKAAWEPRLAQGNDVLLQHAIGGFNAMPPRGGSALSDAEIEAVVDYMLAQAQ